MPFNFEKRAKVVKDVKCYQKRPVVPDGGWGWVVCFAAACTNFTVSGLATSSGIFLIGLRGTFDDPVWKLALVGALLDGLSMLAAPVASVLLVCVSHRTVLMLAGLLGFIGAVLGAFSTSIEMMIATYGIITGVSLGMSFFTCQIITGLYFDKKRALAIGINNCGGGMGTMVINLFFEFFIEIYGLTGTLLLVGGLLLNVAVYGALCRPLPYTYTDAQKTACIDGTDHPTAKELPSSAPDSSNSENIKHRGMINEAFDLSDEKQNTGSPLPAEKSGIKDETIINTEKLRKNSVVECCLISIGAKHFRNIDFVLLTMAYVAWVCSSALYTFVPPLCVWAFGMNRSTAAMLMLFLGFFTTIGELLLGVFVDVFHFSGKKVFMFSLFLVTVCSAMMPFCNQFILMASVASVFGFAIGLGVSLRLVLTIDVAGLEESTKAFSILSVFCGIGYFAAPPTFGLIFDVTKSFVVVFYVGGTCAFTSLILMLLISFREICCKKRPKK
ncbi:monocarboxylate transporter 9-like [Octopus sinensis]|uniref:Monocarboxylate transporter 9-like n=1 Tax=Octopus sinensis TaxID=2607531 RepID=A0A6P7TEC3_9MOLL|nr:monocarboxylate transporter 9-like [Octopus sinensis]